MCPPDGHIILWRRQDQPNLLLSDSDGAEFREHYSIHKTLRGHLQDVYDLSWSADAAYLISGAVDNTAILWDVQKGGELARPTRWRRGSDAVTFVPGESTVLALIICLNMGLFVAYSTVIELDTWYHYPGDALFGALFGEFHGTFMNFIKLICFLLSSTC